MPEGIRLGGAFYELTAESAPLIQAMAQAEQRSKASAQAIAQATGIPEKAVQRLAQTWIRAEQQRANASVRETLRIIRAHNDAASAADAASKKMAASSQQGATGFLTVTRGALGFAAAAAGVTTGAVAINQAMARIAESTQRAGQAQFALNALYGQAAPIITKQAEALAAASGRSRTEALEAATAVANLGRQYAFTFEQQEKVLQISANLAAIKGLSLEAATQRISDALRGEPEAAEYLGQVLNNDAVKAFAAMTDEQRKNFETLSSITKAQITLGKLIGDNSDLMGKAAERANSSVGAHDRLTGSIDNLSVAIGKIFSPSVAQAALRLAGMADQATLVVEAMAKLPAEQSDAEKSLAAFGETVLRSSGAVGQLVAGLIALQQQLRQTPSSIQIGPDPGLPGTTAPGGTSPETARAIEEDRRRRAREAAEEKDRIRGFVERQKRAINDIAEIEERALRQQAERREQAIEREIVRLEVEKAARLKNLEERERAAIKAIEAEQRAEEQAHEATVERLERGKQARLDAAEAAAEAAERAIDAEERRLRLEREREDRALEDTRRTEDRALEDARRVQDRVREQAHRRELERIERERDVNLASIEAEIEAAEKATRQRLRNLDRQADRARKRSEEAVRGIERQADAEDERHRRAMQALDDERDARLEILDAQLRSLDVAGRAEDAARRAADLQRRVAQAQAQATRARGTGTPEQIAEARGDLTRALRVGNEVSIANARERLVQLAGEGNEAIAKADEELAEAQQELAREGVENARDAERDKLKAAQDAIRREVDERKRAEDDAHRRRRADLEDEQRAERDKLTANLERLDKKKQALKDSSDEEIRLLRNTLEAEREAADEQAQIARDRLDAEREILEDRRRVEDRFRDDQRRAQDRLREDERRAQDDALAAQLLAVRDTLEQERKETEAHYTGPNGVITQARKAFEERKLALQAHLVDVRQHFADEKQAINETYRNPAKTGLIDLQDAAKENNTRRLGEQLTDLENWKNAASRFIDDTKEKWKSLAEAVDAVNTAIRKLPSGNVRVTSGPRPSIDGRPVQGPGFDDDNAGGGPGPNPPPAVTPSPSPGIGGQPDDVDVSPERFSVAFGFNQPYTRPFNPAIPNHRGVDLVIAGARDGGRGLPVGAFRGGTVVAATIDPNGGNGIIIQASDGLYDRYFHFDELNVRPGQTVRRGQRIGILGASGTEGFPHVHYEVARGINGDPQDRLIDPRPYMRGRDAGYLFREPTLTYGLRSGERNLIAERRPELLVGGAATAAIIDRRPLLGAGPSTDYAAMGAHMAAAATGGRTGGSYREGDVIFNGLTYGEAEQRQRREQRRRSLLHGVRRLR